MRKFLLLTIVGLIASAAQAQLPAHPEMLVSTDWLAQHLKDPNLVILQLTKEKKDYDQGHVPGARWISFDQLMVTREGIHSELPPVADLVKLFESLGISNDSRVIVYSTNWPPLSTRVYFTLDYLGLGDRASVLDGGLEKWTAEKRAISKEDSKADKPGKITPHVRPEILASLVDVESATKTGSAVIVDSRPDHRYTEGHIPGAVHLYWEKNTQEPDGYELIAPIAISQNYSSAGVKPGKTVITYCEIGWQASHDYFTAKYLGYNAKMYDGSYQEWNEIKHMPVVKGDQPK